MIPLEKRNPFAVLGIPIDASNLQIIERGNECGELAATDEERQEVRDAMSLLVTHPETRLMCELFEINDAAYENPDWERFCRMHRRNPLKPDMLAERCAPLKFSDFNVTALMDLAVNAFLETPTTDIAAVLETLPCDLSYGPPPLEVSDVLFG